jgi:hypothetical protein
MGNFGSLNREPKDDSFGFYFSEFALSETEGKSSLTLPQNNGILYRQERKFNWKSKSGKLTIVPMEESFSFVARNLVFFLTRTQQSIVRTEVVFPITESLLFPRTNL